MHSLTVEHDVFGFHVCKRLASIHPSSDISDISPVFFSVSGLASHLHFSPNSCIALHIHAITSTLGVFALDLRLHSAFQAPASHWKRLPYCPDSHLQCLCPERLWIDGGHQWHGDLEQAADFWWWQFVLRARWRCFSFANIMRCGHWSSHPCTAALLPIPLNQSSSSLM